MTLETLAAAEAMAAAVEAQAVKEAMAAAVEAQAVKEAMAAAVEAQAVKDEVTGEKAMLEGMGMMAMVEATMEMARPYATSRARRLEAAAARAERAHPFTKMCGTVSRYRIQVS